jgi:hypothetical protein
MEYWSMPFWELAWHAGCYISSDFGLMQVRELERQCRHLGAREEALASELTAAKKALTASQAQIVRKGFVAERQKASMQEEAKQHCSMLEDQVCQHMMMEDVFCHFPHLLRLLGILFAHA